MKNLILAILVFSVSGFLFAGNNSNVSQTGYENEAVVEQVGNGHQATVDQFGKNLAEVSQTGGDDNTATVTQGTAAAHVSNNRKPNYNGDHEWGAWIEQVGSSNTAEINMQGSRGSADIYQEGGSNEAYQEINTYASGATSNTRKGLDIDQVGSNNVANQKTVASFGSYGIKKMHVDQVGSGNQADQLSIGGMASVMQVRQDGSNNDYTVDVSATGKASPLDLPFAHKPAGDYIQYQNGRFSTATIDIVGSGNHTAQYQEYTIWSASGHNYADMDIAGDSNNAAQGQLGEFNHSTIDIVGCSNVAAISQQGSGTAEWDGNTASISQTGSNNVSSIEQTMP